MSPRSPSPEKSLYTPLPVPQVSDGQRFFSLISIAHVLYLDDAGQDGSLNDLTHKELLHLKGKAKAADTKEYKISFCSCKRPFFTQLLWRSFEKIKKYLPDVDMKGCFKVFFLWYNRPYTSSAGPILAGYRYRMTAKTQQAFFKQEIGNTYFFKTSGYPVF